MKSLLLLLAIQALLLSTAIFAAPVPIRKHIPGITVSNCEKLKRGMTKLDVIDLFGSKPVITWDNEDGPSLFDPKYASLGEYEASDLEVKIFFDCNDRVLDAVWLFPHEEGKISGIK